MNLRLAIRTACALAAGVAARPTGRAQQEETKSPVPPAQNVARRAGTEDSIETAKRQFDAVKSMRDIGPLSKGGLPRISVPELETGSSLSSVPGAKLKTAETEKRPSNWLVEAMTKQAPTRSGRENEPRTLGQNAERPDSREDRAKSGLENERNEQQVSANPFARFLGDWMTRSDYALLKPGLEKSFSGGAPGLNGPSVASPGESFVLKPAPGLESIGGIGAVKAQPAGGPTAVRENPYLQVLTSTGAGTTGPTIVQSGLKSVPAPTTPLAAPRGGGPNPDFRTEASPPKSKIPEFVKPVTDEKYFKQLKRF